MSVGTRRGIFRWFMSVATVLVLVSTVWSAPSFSGSPLRDSPSSAAASSPLSSTGPPQESVVVGFTDPRSGGSGFIDSLLLEGDGSDHTVELSALGMQTGLHDTLQVLFDYDPAVVEITSIVCHGLFDGGFSSFSAVATAPGQAAFMCGVAGGVGEESGAVMLFSLKRVGPGDTLLRLSSEGDFGTEIFSAGIGSEVTSTGALTLLELVPTPTPASTATPTPTPAPASGGPAGGGGSAPQPQPAPSPTPSASVPGPPTGVVAVAGDGKVEVSWTAPASDGGSSIIENLVRSADGGINRLFTASQAPVTIAGLENGREYRFRVQAINDAGQGAFSEFSEPVIPAGPPSEPQNFIAEFDVATGKVRLAWDAPDDMNGAELESYELSEAGGAVKPLTLGPDARSSSYSGLSPGEYRFLLSAANRGGVGEPTEVMVTVPNVAQQPEDPHESPVAKPPTMAQPGGEQSAAEEVVAEPVSEAATQLRLATGTGVVITDSPLVFEPQGDSLYVVLPALVDSDSTTRTAMPDEGEFVGLSIGELTIVSENGSPSMATIAVGPGAQVLGNVVIVTEGERISANLSDMRLRIVPYPSVTEPVEAGIAHSPAFETAVMSLTSLPAVSVHRLPGVGVPELPDQREIELLLTEHGWAPASDEAIAQSAAWKIEHSENALVGGDTFFSFGLMEPLEPGRELVAIKQSDNGDVHLRRASCHTADVAGTRCTAVFDRKAGGFSTFAVLEVAPTEGSDGQDQLADALANDADASVSSQGPVPGERPALVGEVPANQDSSLAEQTGSNPFENFTPSSQDNSGSSSAVVLIALASVGLVVAVSVAGYFVVGARGVSSSNLSLVAILITAALLLLVASTAYSRGGPASASGTVESQGDAAQLSDEVRDLFGVDGTGITVGVISDSIGCDAAALSADIASGELPVSIDTTNDIRPAFCSVTTDTGRAMAQIIHDVAPGAEILFHGSILSKFDLIIRINLLVAAGVDIIVDDRVASGELMFQDDGVADAIERATAAGVVYITSAGDPGIASYEAPFVRGSGVPPVCGPSGACTSPGSWHDFDPGPGIDTLMDVSLSGGIVRMMLQWDQPVLPDGPPARDSELELAVFDESGETIEVSAGPSSPHQNPGERLVLFDVQSVQVAISHVAGPPPRNVKLVVLNGAEAFEYPADSSTIIGHRNSVDAITVGPVNYADTPVFGEVPKVEDSAPMGGTPILFDDTGNPLNPPVVRQKPDLVAPSGVDTTLGTLDGSSAAAAHTAGAVALLLELRRDLHMTGQLDNETIRAALTQTAIDIDPAGPDLLSGFGLIDVRAVASLLLIEPPNAADDSYSVGAGSALTVDAPGVLANDADQDVVALTAELISGPMHGTVSLQSDGSFIYTPDAGFFGDDAFSYVANDGTFTSAPATVTIAVNGAESLASSISLQGADSLSDFGTDTIFVSIGRGASTSNRILAPGGPAGFRFEGLTPGMYNLGASVPGYLVAEQFGIQIGAKPGTTVSLPSVRLLGGDSNSDGQIDEFDALLIADSFGSTHAPGIRRSFTGEIVDINGDGVTNGEDASLAISNIGLVEPTAWTE